MKLKIKAYKVMFIIIATTLFMISSFVIKNAFVAHAKFAPPMGPCDPPMNPIVCENSKTDGRTEASPTPTPSPNPSPNASPSPYWGINGIGDTSIQGFATDISVNKGGTVQFKIQTGATNYHLDIYRMGYYGGSGARKQATVEVALSQAQTQPACIDNRPTGSLDCSNWDPSTSWSVPTDAVSGIYFAKVIRNDTGGASHIFFIVRDDSSGSDLLFQTSDTTWQAYNFYDVNTQGKSLYGDRAYKVSYNRPFHTGGNAQFSWVLNAEYPMVRWLEANGYNVSYTTGVDMSKSDAVGKITPHKVFLSVGHDEYWSDEQRTHVEAARNAGVNLAFFSGNEVYYKVRWDDNFRTMICYKETYDDAAENADPSSIWTGTWRDPRFSPPADGGRPENALVGGMFTVNEHIDTQDDAIDVPAAEYRSLRFWRGIDFGSNPKLAPGTIGFEWGSDVDNGYRPAGLMRLSATTRTNPLVIHDWGTNPGGFSPGTATHNLTLYRHASGALVFGASTVQWSWGLDNHHDRFLYGAQVDDRMKQATVNILADMGAQPATIQSPQTAASQSTDSTRPSSSFTAPPSNVQMSSAITINGTAADTGGGVVAGVEVSVDGGVTWRPATGLATWSYTWTPATVGTATIKSRAVDDSGNLEIPSGGVSVNVSPTSCSCGGCVNGAPSTSSLSFNGTNAYVRIPNNDSIDIKGPVTVEAWIKTNSAGTQQGIVERYGYPGKENNGGYALRLLANGKLGFYTLADGRYLYDFLQGSTTVSTGVWHHVAGVFDGNQMRIYLDGVLDGSKVSTFAPTHGTTDLIIGARGSDATTPFNGLIDEVRLTAGALYATKFVPSIRLSPTGNTKGLWRFESIQGSQISDSSCNANNGTIQGTGNPSTDVAVPGSLGLTGYWKFDEGTGTSTTDASGNGNTGVLTNGPGWTTGLVNNALSFGGTSYVDMGSPTSLTATDALTITAWIYPTGPGTNGTTGGTIVSKEGEYVLARFPDGTIQWGLANTNPGWVFVNTGYVAPLNEWTHIALVYSNWSVQTYANGLLVHTFNGAGVIGDQYPGMNSFRVGGREVAPQVFQGKIDEVRVYNRGLSAADVENLAPAAGYWRLDEVNGATTPDSSGNGLTGTLTNGPTLTAGKVNNALSFAGGTDYVQIGAQPSLVMSNSMTVSAWIFPTGPGSNTSTGGTIVSKEGEYVIARFPDGTIQWGFANINPGWAYVNTGQVAPLNQWTHVAVVYNGGTIKTYFNGTLVHTYSGAGVIDDVYTSMNDFRIGGRQITSQHFQGKIDEVRVYSHALTAANVESLANVPPTPVGYWRFGEVNGTTTPDSSGNGLTGTLNGPTLTIGRVNNALSFNGSTDYVQVGAQQSLVMSNSMTVSAWICPTGPGSNTTTGGTIVSKEGEYVIARFPDGTIQWGFANTTPGWLFVNTGQTAPLNQWTHIAVVYDGGTIKTYFNGTLVHTYSGAGVIDDVYTSMNDFRIGGRQITSQHFQGKIDEVRVYNFALGGNEVAALAQ
jgi:hypothetical protein